MTKKLGMLLTLLSLLAALILPGAKPAQAQSSLKDRLQAAADQAIANGLAGVSIAVQTPRDGMILVVAGKSDVKEGTDLKTTDIARIASASKVYVGTVVMQLVAEKKVALTDPIAKYISAAQAKHIVNTDKATVAQLLTHSSGIYDYYSDDFGKDAGDKTDFTLDEALKYAWDEPASFEPGAKFSYSNTNTVLLAVMIEKVTGMGFAKAIRERILKPLDLKNSYVEVFEPVPVKIVRGYGFESSGETTVIGDKYRGGGLPDGCMVTTPEDMVKFLKGLFVDGKLLDAATLKDMMAPHAKSDESSIGYHIFIDKTANGLKYSHTGSILGYASEMAYFPDSGTIFAIWANSSGGKAEKAFNSIDMDTLIFQK